MSSLHCPQCGMVNSDDSRYCLGCGVVLPVQGAAVPVPAVQAATLEPSIYAGFWRRFAATLLDGLILGIAGSLLSVLLFIPRLLQAQSSEIRLHTEFGGGLSLYYLVTIFGSWLYFALFESSRRRATPGKMAIGLAVTDLQGGRLSFGRATGRHFAKLISAMICYMGFIIAGFTGKKQALHDMIAGTLVIRSAASAAVGGPQAAAAPPEQA